jgi:hypothetical protein
VYPRGARIGNCTLPSLLLGSWASRSHPHAPPQTGCGGWQSILHKRGGGHSARGLSGLDVLRPVIPTRISSRYSCADHYECTCHRCHSHRRDTHPCGETENIHGHKQRPALLRRTIPTSNHCARPQERGRTDSLSVSADRECVTPITSRGAPHPLPCCRLPGPSNRMQPAGVAPPTCGANVCAT